MTIRELAGEIGVSPATISMVLNGKGDISEQTRAKVLEAVEKYGIVFCSVRTGEAVIWLRKTRDLYRQLSMPLRRI